MELILTAVILTLAVLALALVGALSGRALRSACGGTDCEGACMTCPRRRPERTDG